MAGTASIKAFKEAKRYIPGGVNSPVRAFSQLDGNPVFIRKSQGAYIEDIDNKKYIDYCLSWGVFIQGHNHPHVYEKTHEALKNGSSFGAPTLAETALAKRITGHYPSMEKVRLVNSGTEAVMSAIRLARAVTGRSIIVKFDGCYHGHSDSLLVNAGSGLAGIKNSSSRGITAAAVSHTISIPFNDSDALLNIFEKYGNDIAAIITEPVPANMGLIIPNSGYLTQMKELCQYYKSLLIFDEVITGFRFGLSGAQGWFNIKPNITCLGKIIGGGFPVGAYGASDEIMQQVAPLGEMYQAGTLSGNPVAVSAGLAAIELLEQPGFYEELNKKAAQFSDEVERITNRFGIRFHRMNSMFSFFFNSNSVKNYRDVTLSDMDKFKRFYLSMLEKGAYLSPSGYETNFISRAHSGEDLSKTAEALENTLKELNI